MAFNDLPTVDDKSERSEESVLKVKSFFTRKKNGFICRHESPDYRTDQDVELVESSGATSWKFPIRIKSANTVKVG